MRAEHSKRGEEIKVLIRFRYSHRLNNLISLSVHE